MALDYVIRYAGTRINGEPTEGPEEVPTGYLEGSIDLEAGAIGSATFTLPPGHPWNEDGAFRTCDPRCEITISERYGDYSLAGDRPEAELFRGWVVETAQDGDLRMRVDCDGMLAYLKATTVRPYACTPSNDLPDGTTIVNGDPFKWLLEQHARWAGPDYAFKPGHLCRTGPVEAGTDYKSTWDEMQDKFCTGKDRFLHARTDDFGDRVVDLLDGGAGESTQAIVVGENVLDFSFGRHDREVVTAIVARGTTDDTYRSDERESIDRREFGLEGADAPVYRGRCSDVVVEGDRAVNWSMVEAYGYREERRDYDAKTPDVLARMACEDLDPLEIDERMVRSIDVTFFDLHSLNPKVQPIRLLDWVEVYIRADGMRRGDAEGRTIFHGWLPCTAVHIDLANPENSTYHLGDLEETLTRKSALRLGMMRRATGGLVRRADATPWDNDRIWNRTDDVEEESRKGDEELREELGMAADDWSQHLDEETKRWYESLDEAKREDAQGREDLLKHLDEVEGKWDDEVGRIDGELGTLDGALGDLDSKVDRNHTTLLDGIREVAQNAQRTFFGICRTSGSTAQKVVNLADLTQPGGEAFQLVKGVVVEVQFQQANTAASPSLSIANTGVARIVTNGSQVGLWQSGEVVRFVYDGTYWQCCSVDIYGSSITVGNPSGANFYTNGNVAQLRIGSNVYWSASMTGQTIGLASQSHVDIGSSNVTFANPQGTNLQIGYGDSRSHAKISDPNGIVVNGGTDFSEFGNNYGKFSVSQNGDASMGSGSVSFGVRTSGYTTNAKPWIMRSIVTNIANTQYPSFSPSQLGVNTLSGYAFCVTNGDANAKDFYVDGTQVTPTWMALRLDRVVNGRVRLNFLGVPVDVIYSD